MIIKHIMHSREWCFSYCHKNIKGEKHELKQKMRGKKGAKIGARRGGIPSFSFNWFLCALGHVGQPCYSGRVAPAKKKKKSNWNLKESSPAYRCSSLPANVQGQTAVMQHPPLFFFLLRGLLLFVAEPCMRRAPLQKVSIDPWAGLNGDGTRS